MLPHEENERVTFNSLAGNLLPLKPVFNPKSVFDPKPVFNPKPVFRNPKPVCRNPEP